MIGEYDDRPPEKLWRDIKRKKMEKLVKTRADKERWSIHVRDLYQKILENRIGLWDAVETKYISEFCKEVIDDIKFY